MKRSDYPSEAEIERLTGDLPVFFSDRALFDDVRSAATQEGTLVIAIHASGRWQSNLADDVVEVIKNHLGGSYDVVVAFMHLGEGRARSLDEYRDVLAGLGVKPSKVVPIEYQSQRILNSNTVKSVLTSRPTGLAASRPAGLESRVAELEREVADLNKHMQLVLTMLQQRSS